MKPIVAKEKIMNTASRLFYEQGYNLTGINQIIEEAEISKPSLYNHFKSKNDLLMAYLDERYANWFEEYNDFTKDITDPYERLMSLFDFRIDRQIKSGYGGCVWNKIVAEAPKEEVQVFERTTKFKNAIKVLVVDMVKQLNRPQGQLLSDEELAETVFLHMEGGVIMAYITKSHQALENAKEIVRKLI